MGPGGRGTSSLLFLTADKNWFKNISPNKQIDIQYTWGRTQRRPVANGTSGDVVGVNLKPIPEPSAFVGLFAVSVFGLSMKQKKH
jgi:hypothetical protein